MIITDINVQQMVLVLKFEMALICNDLKRYKESQSHIEDALKKAKKYTLGAIIPYLLYAKGESFWLRDQKEISIEYIKKAYEFHKMLAPECDEFITVEIRIKQKGIKMD
jgi:tetratricopeptide (TPR) repeat protein